MKKLFSDKRNLLRAVLYLLPVLMLGLWLISNAMIKRSATPYDAGIYPPSEGLGNVIYIQPVGNVDEGTLEFIKDSVISSWGRKTRILDPIQPPYFEGTRTYQIKADFLRHYIIHTRGIPKDTFRIIIVTDEDLYAEGYNFIFGQAGIGGIAALMSTHRLKPMMDGGVLIEDIDDLDRDIYYDRLLKLLKHELGHTFGLIHCHDSNCVMSFHPSLRELDAGGAEFCDNCMERLMDNHRPLKP